MTAKNAQKINAQAKVKSTVVASIKRVGGAYVITIPATSVSKAPKSKRGNAIVGSIVGGWVSDKASGLSFTAAVVLKKAGAAKVEASA